MNSGLSSPNKTLVLVIDDDAFTLSLVRETMEQNGFSVEERMDGEQGLAAFISLKPDIVLLDVMLPGMDGFAVCREIRRHPEGADTPILLMTGLDDVESIRQAYVVGATDFIVKPIKWMILGYRVQYILRASRAFQELSESKARLSFAQRIARIGSWEWDIVEDKVLWSDEIFQIFDLAPFAFDGSYHSFIDSIHPLDREFVNQAVEEAIFNNKPLSIDHQILLPTGTERYVHTEASVTLAENGRAVRMAGTVQDITERKRAEEQIRTLAYYDTVTGLPNRILFKEYLEHALAFAERHSKVVATLFLDLDRFKAINDTLGHVLGDLLLQQVADRLRSCIRKADLITRDSQDKPTGTVARLGGDEFTVLLEEIGRPQDAAKVARRILEEIARPFTLDGHEVFVTASIGISLYPADGNDVTTLIKNADTAMYHAKDLGRNNFQFYTQSMNASAFERLLLESRLRKALERDEFIVYYQPQVDIRSRRVVGLEALIRWRNPDLGLVLPSAFVSLAEETGIIIPIDEWVLFTVCNQIKAWHTTGTPPVRVAINLSGQHFMMKNLLEVVGRVLHMTGVDPSLLELEITEGSLIQNVADTNTVLNSLKDMGITLSIDDFGTGYSSLSYLKRFPIDTLKIDQSFVREIGADADSEAITMAIIAMAKRLKMRVIAEGVEKAEQQAFLEAHGCTIMQGYLFGHPASADIITPILLDSPDAVTPQTDQGSDPSPLPLSPSHPD